MPKPPKPPVPPTTPTRASFISRGTVGNNTAQGGRIIRPITGGSRTQIGRPSLLGGV